MSDIHTSDALGMVPLPIGAPSTKFQMILLLPDAAIKL